MIFFFPFGIETVLIVDVLVLFNSLARNTKDIHTRIQKKEKKFGHFAELEKQCRFESGLSIQNQILGRLF